MEVQLAEGHPRIDDVRNQIAIQRVPIGYCIESPDLPADATILDVYVRGSSESKANHRPTFLGGVTTIGGEVLLRGDKGDGMCHAMEKPEWKPYRTEFVPYIAWSTRGTAESTVLMPVLWDVLQR